MTRRSLYTALRTLFFVSLAEALLVVVLGQTDLLPNGIWADDGHRDAAFVADIVAIILTVTALPVLTRYAGKHLERRPATSDDATALRHYYRWSTLRLAVWSQVQAGCLAIYYLTLSTTGLLCALIMLLATLCYCRPNSSSIARYMGDVDSHED